MDIVERIEQLVESKKEKLIYSGADDTKSLHAWCAKQSLKGGYIVYYTIFGEVTAYRLDAVPSSAYAPSDYPAGYWHKGVHNPWSAARKLRLQNAGPKGSDR